MELQDVPVPDYRINEYRLVIPLSEVLQEKIRAVRKGLHEKYKVPLPFWIPPSLTVLKCHAFEKTEPRLVEQLQHIALGTDVFTVKLEDYAAYPSHTIFINVLTKSPFNELAKELKKAKRLMQIPKHEPHFINEPHLIIAQKLKPMQFIKMWMECEHTQFSGSYRAGEMVLLRRGSQQYEEVRRMQFMSLPLNVKQGTLFAC